MRHRTQDPHARVDAPARHGPEQDTSTSRTARRIAAQAAELRHELAEQAAATAAIKAARQQAASARLLILPCGATKDPAPGFLPARQRYTGSLWQTYRKVDPAGSRAALAVLSARYGLMSGDRPTLPYDQQMTPDVAEAIRLGGITRHWPEATPDGEPGPERCRNSARYEMGQLRDRTGCTAFVEVCIVGGKAYQQVAQALVAGLKVHGIVAADAQVVAICDQPGYMRQQLRQWLTGGTA